MKNKMKSAFMVALMGTGLFFTSCSDTENIDPVTADTTYKLEMAEDGGDKSVEIYASDVQGEEIEVLVNLTSTSDNMRRVYVTRNADGAGEEPFKWEGTGITNNGDDSVNLDAGKSFVQKFVIPKSTIVKGTEVYKIWATKSKGDFRNTENSFIVGIGTITINYGGTNPAADVKEFSAKILAAPLADGTSQSFISTVNGDLYTINGAAEYSAFWDFGYYYGATNHASLASPDEYPSSVIDIRTRAGLDANAALNNCYFKKSTEITAAQFDNITKAAELNTINVAATDANEVITGLATGNILEFVDNYGKKGLIKVSEINGTYNNGDYIKIEVKIQP